MTKDVVEILDRLLHFDKISARLFLVLSLGAGFLLLAPDAWLSTLRLQVFMQDYGWIIGLVFIVSGLLFLTEIVDWTRKPIKKAKVNREINKVISENLDEQEKAILREFFRQGKNTIQLPIDNPIVAGLIKKGFLEYIGAAEFIQGVRLVSVMIPLTIAPFINPTVVGLSTAKELTEETKNYTQCSGNNERP